MTDHYSEILRDEAAEHPAGDATGKILRAAAHELDRRAAENARLSAELTAEREKAREGLLADLENSVTTMTGFDAVTKNVNLHMTIELYEELRAALAPPTEAPKA